MDPGMTATSSTGRIDVQADDSDRQSTLERRIRQGMEGGALATAVMTVYRLPVTRSLPPTAEFWARFVGGGDPADYPLQALALHLGYGVAAGALFAAALPSRESVRDGADRPGPPAPSEEARTTLLGLAYGLVLSAFGERVVLDSVLETTPDDRFALHVGHVLYGITLGAWVGTRTRSGHQDS